MLTGRLQRRVARLPKQTISSWLCVFCSTACLVCHAFTFFHKSCQWDSRLHYTLRHRFVALVRVCLGDSVGDNVLEYMGKRTRGCGRRRPTSHCACLHCFRSLLV
jgi:hypothetical protein